MVEDEVSISLVPSAYNRICRVREAYFGKAIPIEDESVQQLPGSEWHQHPTADP